MGEADGSASYLQDIPFHYVSTESGMAGSLEITDELVVPGHGLVHISVLAGVADVITGIPITDRTGPAIAMTVDLAVRMVAPFGAGMLEMESRIVKLGRSICISEATFSDGDRPVARAWGTFMSSPRPQDVLPELPVDRVVTDDRMGMPFMDALGATIVAPGVVEVQRRPYVMQPAGTLQGGVVCAMAELAAADALDGPITEIDVRYISAIRHGPGRAAAELLSPGSAQVTGTDAGHPDQRVTSMSFARTSSL